MFTHIQCCFMQMFDYHICASFCLRAALSLSRSDFEACCIAQAAGNLHWLWSPADRRGSSLWHTLKQAPPYLCPAPSRCCKSGAHADFSDTIDSELQTAPSLCLMYLYLLTLAQNTPRLDPSQRPTTTAELKWGCVDTKRKRAARVVNDPVADGDSDDINRWC